MIGQYLKIWNLRVQKNLNIEKITFKVVQMKFLAMHITNQKLSFDIFTVENLLNIFMEHDLNILMIFAIKKRIILTHTMYCCLLLQIYLCYLWLLLCCRDTYMEMCYLIYCIILFSFVRLQCSVFQQVTFNSIMSNFWFLVVWCKVQKRKGLHTYVNNVIC